MDPRISAIPTQPLATSNGSQLSFQLHLQTTEALWRACSQLIAVGELFVPTSQPPTVGREISLQLVAGEVCPPAIPGRVLRIDAVGPPGFQAKVASNDEFKDFFAREVRKRRMARRQGGKRWHNRYRVDFEVGFEDFPENGMGRAVNFSRGGIFVAHPNPPVVGSKVRIAIGLPRGDKLSGLTKVVHVVTPTQASALHCSPGAGLSFLRSDQKLIERIAALTAEYEQPPPRLLLVDDDDDFRAALSDALRVTGMKVDEARTGEEALRKLVDTLFDLDVVLLDIRMPGMDGRGFLDRVRRLGGELDLRIIVLSAAPRAELLALKGPGAANDALSKADDLAEIVNRIKHVVGKEASAEEHPPAS